NSRTSIDRLSTDKMRLDVEIKELFQKKEQEIVGVLEKFKNRVLKKDKAVTKYLGIQHQTSMEEMELLELNRSTNQPNKVINQAQIVKDTLLQLECGTHDYGTKELQATINRDVSAYCSCKCKLEARELQEEIVRINRTTHLLERESPTDIEISEKEEVSPIIADVTNEVEVIQDSLQSMSIQEENKKSLSTKVVYLTHDKAREDISASRWAPHNRKITTMTNQSSGREKPVTIITIWDLPEDARNLQSKQATATQEKEFIENSRNGEHNDMNNTGSLPERKLLEEILERLSNLERKQ
ncbi:18853_t:CDS:2, partial [Gigaspora margarita]